MSKFEKADRFISEVQRLINNNYGVVSIDKNRPNNGIIKSESSNSIITRIYIKPNKYHEDVFNSEELREHVEEIASLAVGYKANSITDTRKAREEKPYSNYGGPVKILGISSSDRYPLFEIKYKYLNPDYS